MKSQALLLTALAFFSTTAVRAQDPAANRETVPIYKVTVIERTVKAVNYQYRGGPTQIDFRGTVLLPMAKGQAVVESKAGRTELDAKFEHVEPPTKYGNEYLTYVLWAITPEGHAKNLGEVLANGGDHASMRVTTDLQAFGLIVTAEPYSAVRQPSNVVVMENEIRPDTIGKIEQVNAKYELLPRGSYTYTVPIYTRSAESEARKLPMDRYEALLEVYQAQNAMQIAQSAGADRYAADTFSRASQLLRNAQDLQARNAGRSAIVTTAREAAQTAEDARMIAQQHKHDEELAQARGEAARERERRIAAEANANRAQQEASADREQLDGARTARERAEAEASAYRTPPPPPPAVVVQSTPAPRDDSRKTALRASLLQQFGATLATRDTPRGLVITVPDADFRGTALNPAFSGAAARIATSIAAYPGLAVQVDGHTDNAGSAASDEQFSYQRAVAVRDALVRAGIPVNAIYARGLGSTRPVVANTSAAGRQQNRRVEITVSGDPIGTLPYWDKTYSIVPQR